MIGLAQRKAPSFSLTRYYPPVSISQSGEKIPDFYLGIIISQQNFNSQNNFDTTNISCLFFPYNRIPYNLQLYNSLPFSGTESPKERAFSSCVNDGIRRYKLVNNTESYDVTPAKIFLSTLELLSYITIPRITFYTDAVKARITYCHLEFIIDYDYEEPELVFISTFEGDKLIVKDGPIKTLLQILESF